MQKIIKGRIVDVHHNRTFKGKVVIEGEIIADIIEDDSVTEGTFILPGLVDAHIHIESSMLVPSRFARLALPHGVVATVSDPHEIANVLGEEGVDYMIEEARQTKLKIFFGAPSCVPATPYETSGAVLDEEVIGRLMKRNDIYYLAEMMNFPGVLQDDEEVMKKLAHARLNKKPVDGHAPGLSGEDVRKYAYAGITTDHESSSQEEAVEKLKQGIKLLIREGSAAKNFSALADLIDYYPHQVMFCTDDAHPDDLQKKYIDKLVNRAWLNGNDFYTVLRAATVNPVEHYNLPVGLLRKGDKADFIVVDDFDMFHVEHVYIDGKEVYANGEILEDLKPAKAPNVFNAQPVAVEDIAVEAKTDAVRAIVAHDGSLLTSSAKAIPQKLHGHWYSRPEADVLKIVVVNRYKKQKPAVGFVKNFGLKEGAIASTVAHDSHNIIAVGASDEAIVKAINEVVAHKGGIVAWKNEKEKRVLPLEVAGLMTRKEGPEVAAQYKAVNKFTQGLGTQMRAPFMTLAFMALLVIPELKIGDKGLFDVSSFSFTHLDY